MNISNGNEVYIQDDQAETAINFYAKLLGGTVRLIEDEEPDAVGSDSYPCYVLSIDDHNIIQVLAFPKGQPIRKGGGEGDGKDTVELDFDEEKEFRGAWAALAKDAQEIAEEPEEVGYGVRRGELIDKFGLRWVICYAQEEGE